MAMTVTEASAVNTVLLAAAGLRDAAGEEPDLEQLEEALDVLVGAAYKKLVAGVAPADVRSLALSIYARPPGADEPDVDIETAPVPGGHLPEFEGVIPVGIVTRILGAGGRIQRPMHLGEQVVVLVEGTVDDVSHRDTKDGIKRHQKIDVDDLFEMTGPGAARLLNNMKERYRLADDGEVLPFGQAVDDLVAGGATGQGRTDASGVALTPGDEAELGLDDDEWEDDGQ